MTSFEAVRARAEKRKCGAKALEKLLPPKPDAKALAKIGDDRVLAEMAKRVFSAGFAWSVIEAKWPAKIASPKGTPPTTAAHGRPRPIASHNPSNSQGNQALVAIGTLCPAYSRPPK